LGDVTKHKLLKHRILIGLLGCGLRCMAKCGLRLGLIENNSKSFKAKAKDRYVPLSEHLIRGLKKYEAEKLKIIF
jgi:integrase